MDGHTLRRNRDPAARQPALLAEWVRLLKDWTMSVQSVHAGEQGPICLISSLSHMLADGHTYYIHNMLSPNTEICALNRQLADVGAAEDQTIGLDEALCCREQRWKAWRQMPSSRTQHLTSLK